MPLFENSFSSWVMVSTIESMTFREKARLRSLLNFGRAWVRHDSSRFSNIMSIVSPCFKKATGGQSDSRFKRNILSVVRQGLIWLEARQQPSRFLNSNVLVLPRYGFLTYLTPYVKALIYRPEMI